MLSGTSLSFAKTEPCDISKEEIRNILVKFIPDVKILDIRKSPLEVLCEIAIESKGNKVILYIDQSKKKLFLGSIIDVDTMVDLTKKRVMDINRVDVSKIPLDDALLLGSADAKYKVIVFTDPE
jgi:thiol:disulfide interchange protein DsbC